MLQTLPETPARTQQELMLHVALGGSLVAVQGHATRGGTGVREPASYVSS